MLTCQTIVSQLLLTEFCNFPRLALIRNHQEFFTGIRRTGQAENLDRNRRPGTLDLLTVLVQHGANATVMLTSQNHVTTIQSTGLHQQTRHHTTTLVDTGLDHHTLRRARRYRFEFEYFSLHQNRIQQLINTLTGQRRHINELRITAPLFRNNFLGGQIRLHTIKVDAGLVDFVHCHHDRHTSCAGVINRFCRLRHHAVISGHYQHDDVGTLGTTGTHGGKRRVTGSIQERNHAVTGFDVIGADMLGNATRFTRSNAGTTDIIQQRGLTVVNVTHDSHHRCARPGITFLTMVFQRFDQRVFNRVCADQFDLVTHLFDDQLGDIALNHLVDGGHDAQTEQRLHNRGTLDGHLLGKVGHRNAIAQYYFAHDWSCRALEPVFVDAGRILPLRLLFLALFLGRLARALDLTGFAIEAILEGTLNNRILFFFKQIVRHGVITARATLQLHGHATCFFQRALGCFLFLAATLFVTQALLLGLACLLDSQLFSRLFRHFLGGRSGCLFRCLSGGILFGFSDLCGRSTFRSFFCSFSLCCQTLLLSLACSSLFNRLTFFFRLARSFFFGLTRSFFQLNG